MSRPGVTYQDIANAANELKSQEKRVTIENVRSILGTGSIGTINNHLRKWKEAESSIHGIAAQESLPDSLVSLMKGLWEGVLTQSREQFHPVEAQYQSELAELRSEVEKYKNNNQRWQKLFDQWQQEKISLANEKLTLEQALKFAHKENQTLHDKQDGLLNQLQEKQERIDELHRLHQQTQRNLEHYRESAREQRLLDQQQFEREKQQLLFETKELKEQLITQQIKYSELQQQNQFMKHSYDELDNKHNQSLLVIESLQNETQQLEKNNIEHQQMKQHWQNQFNDLQKNFETKITENFSLQGDNKLLNQQLIDIKDTLSNIKDHNKLLANEKWELVQVKAQLEGQVKQMQKMVTA